MSAKEFVSHLACQRAQGDAFWVLGDHYELKVSSEETMGALAAVDLTAFPQNGLPPHIHHCEVESFNIVLEKLMTPAPKHPLEIPLPG